MTAVDTSASRDSQRVLVVDDDQALCRAVVRLLTRAGYAVDSAHTVASALELALTARPHVIVLDVRLGAEDGTALLPKLPDALGAGTPPIILCSGDDIDAGRAAAVVRRAAPTAGRGPCRRSA